LLRKGLRRLGVLASNGRCQAAIGDIHLSDQLFHVIDDDDSVDRAKRLVVLQLGIPWNLSQAAAVDRRFLKIRPSEAKASGV
jgi:hypothetical protein